jgi:hypothetical protein
VRGRINKNNLLTPDSCRLPLAFSSFILAINLSIISKIAL